MCGLWYGEIMRDPERINRILNLVDWIWNKYPDQRLFQLLSNSILMATDKREMGNSFYLEDELLEDYLIKYKHSITEIELDELTDLDDEKRV